MDKIRAFFSKKSEVHDWTIWTIFLTSLVGLIWRIYENFVA